MKRMKKCEVCKAYTLDESHCGKPTHGPHPPKFSIEDKYAKYRRMNRRPEFDFNDGNHDN